MIITNIFINISFNLISTIHWFLRQNVVIAPQRKINRALQSLPCCAALLLMCKSLLQSKTRPFHSPSSRRKLLFMQSTALTYSNVLCSLVVLDFWADAKQGWEFSEVTLGQEQKQFLAFLGWLNRLIVLLLSGQTQVSCTLFIWFLSFIKCMRILQIPKYV